MRHTNWESMESKFRVAERRIMTPAPCGRALLGVEWITKMPQYYWSVGRISRTMFSDLIPLNSRGPSYSSNQALLLLSYRLSSRCLIGLSRPNDGESSHPKYGRSLTVSTEYVAQWTVALDGPLPPPIILNPGCFGEMQTAAGGFDQSIQVIFWLDIISCWRTPLGRAEPPTQQGLALLITASELPQRSFQRRLQNYNVPKHADRAELRKSWNYMA